MIFKPLHLVTKRLTIRWLDLQDTAALFDVYSNAEAMRYWSSPPMGDSAEAKAIILSAQEGYAAHSALRLAVALKESNLLIGTVSIFAISTQSKRAEIGYILNRDYWQQGYMSEALSAVTAYAFEGLGLNRLEADIDPQNIGSAKSLLRQGFIKEGLLRERWIVNGAVSDSELYGLLRRDWAQKTGR